MICPRCGADMHGENSSNPNSDGWWVCRMCGNRIPAFISNLVARFKTL